MRMPLQIVKMCVMIREDKLFMCIFCVRMFCVDETIFCCWLLFYLLVVGCWQCGYEFGMLSIAMLCNSNINWIHHFWNFVRSPTDPFGQSFSSIIYAYCRISFLFLFFLQLPSFSHFKIIWENSQLVLNC